ncbi:MAG: hypothetical protein HQL67_02065 [Magnetococcales bacterium]|nr:hypothetical protein [Magnetococcales bacterium]
MENPPLIPIPVSHNRSRNNHFKWNKIKKKAKKTKRAKLSVTVIRQGVAIPAGEEQNQPFYDRLN